MFEKVSKKEIEDIKKRLESELEDKYLPFQRKEEVESLIIYLNIWLDWRDHQEREHYREVIKSESWEEKSMVGNYNDVTGEDKEFFGKISKLDPLFFSRGYSAEEINKILKENGIVGNITFVKKLENSYKVKIQNLK